MKKRAVRISGSIGSEAGVFEHWKWVVELTHYSNLVWQTLLVRIGL